MKGLALQELESVLASGEKALVMFTADWCPFCRRFESIFDGAKSPYVHYAVKVNEDESPLWDRFDIKAVPTLAAFRNGQMVARRESRLGAGLGKGEMDSILKEL
ncbi:MAG: thioredoxin family protein [Nitrososphaera sp.]|uniref:thioredoxin family protein n=1 Tax=Nitrososphaera sp. TaxID=1971748 RepID=UPI003D6F2D1F